MPNITSVQSINSRSQWPRGLRGTSISAAAGLRRSWVRIPLVAWTSVCCECCVLSGRGLCDELITRPEESYLLWCVVVCDLEKITLVNEDEGQDPLGGYRAKKNSHLITLIMNHSWGNDSVKEVVADGHTFLTHIQKEMRYGTLYVCHRSRVNAHEYLKYP